MPFRRSPGEQFTSMVATVNSKRPWQVAVSEDAWRDRVVRVPPRPHKNHSEMAEFAFDARVPVAKDKFGPFVKVESSCNEGNGQKYEGKRWPTCWTKEKLLWEGSPTRFKAPTRWSFASSNKGI